MSASKVHREAVSTLEAAASLYASELGKLRLPTAVELAQASHEALAELAQLNENFVRTSRALVAELESSEQVALNRAIGRTSRELGGRYGVAKSRVIASKTSEIERRLRAVEMARDEQQRRKQPS